MPFDTNIWTTPTNAPGLTAVATNSLNTAVNTPENTAVATNLKLLTYMRQLSNIEEIFGQDSYQDSNYLYINLANFTDIDIFTISGTGLLLKILLFINNRLQYKFIDFTKVGEYNSETNLITEFILRVGKSTPKDKPADTSKLKPSDL